MESLYSFREISKIVATKEAFAMVSTERRVVLYNFEAPSHLHIYPDVHKRMVSRLVWHPDRPDCLLTVCCDGQMRLFDKDGKTEACTFKNPSAGYLDAKFARWDTNMLAAAKDNGEMEVWDIRNPDNFVFQRRLHMAPISSIDWNPTVRNVLLTGSTDKHVKVYNLKDFDNAEQILDISGYSSVGTVRWNEDSKYEFCVAFSQNSETSIFQYHMLSPTFPVAIYKGHTEPVTDFAWLHREYHIWFVTRGDSTYLLSCAKDDTAIIRHKSQATKPYLDLNVSAVCISPSNSLVYHNGMFYPHVSPRLHRIVGRRGQGEAAGGGARRLFREEAGKSARQGPEHPPF